MMQRSITFGCLALCVFTFCGSGVSNPHGVLTASLGSLRSARALGEATKGNTDPTILATNERIEHLIREGRLTGDLNRYTLAKTEIDEVLKHAPRDPRTLRNAAWVATIFHQFDKAIRHSLIATGLEPTNAGAFGVLSDAYVELGMYEEAEAAVQTMLDLKPSLESYSRGAHLLWLKGETTMAISVMSQAVDAGPAKDEATDWCRVQLSDMYLKVGSLSTAEGLCNAVLARNPNYTHAKAGLARVVLCRGDYALAINLLEQATLQPENAPLVYLLELERLYRIVESTDKADAVARVMERVAQQHRQLGITGDEITLALLHADRGEELEAAAKEAMAEAAFHRTPQARACYAWVLHKGGCTVEAASIVPQILEYGLRDPVLLGRMAVICAAAGKSEVAETLFREARMMNEPMCAFWLDAGH